MLRNTLGKHNSFGIEIFEWLKMINKYIHYDKTTQYAFRGVICDRLYKLSVMCVLE